MLQIKQLTYICVVFFRCSLVYNTVGSLERWRGRGERKREGGREEGRWWRWWRGRKRRERLEMATWHSRVNYGLCALWPRFHHTDFAIISSSWHHAATLGFPWSCNPWLPPSSGFTLICFTEDQPQAHGPHSFIISPPPHTHKHTEFNPRIYSLCTRIFLPLCGLSLFHLKKKKNLLPFFLSMCVLPFKNNLFLSCQLTPLPLSRPLLSLSKNSHFQWFRPLCTGWQA